MYCSSHEYRPAAASRPCRRQSRALGAMPSTSPISVPKIDALVRFPAAVVAVCVPCPSASRGERISSSSIGPVSSAPSINQRAPISLLLQSVVSNCSPGFAGAAPVLGLVKYQHIGQSCGTDGKAICRARSPRPSCCGTDAACLPPACPAVQGARARCRCR